MPRKKSYANKKLKADKTCRANVLSLISTGSHSCQKRKTTSSPSSRHLSNNPHVNISPFENAITKRKCISRHTQTCENIGDKSLQKPETNQSQSIKSKLAPAETPIKVIKKAKRPRATIRKAKNRPHLTLNNGINSIAATDRETGVTTPAQTTEIDSQIGPNINDKNCPLEEPYHKQEIFTEGAQNTSALS